MAADRSVHTRLILSANAVQSVAGAGVVRHLGDDLIEVEIECANGSKPRRAFARPDILERAREAPIPPDRIRILSPFDPVLRDRKRTERLFGFHYRIEVFVPSPKRKYGYYVFPILEGNRLIGRIDMRCHRDVGSLTVRRRAPLQSIGDAPPCAVRRATKSSSGS